MHPAKKIFVLCVILFAMGLLPLFSYAQSVDHSIADCVQWIEDTQTTLGAWTPGDTSVKYARALRALTLAGNNSHMRREIYLRVKKMQSVNGSWGNSVLRTSSALWALMEAGELKNASVIRKGVLWLKSEQYNDGHWTDVSTVPKTALSCIALYLAGEEESEEFIKGIEWLKTWQNGDGWWGKEPGDSSTPSINFYPLYALYLNDPENQDTLDAKEWLRNYSASSSIWYLITCMGLAYVEDTEVLPTRVSQVISSQHDDGGWADDSAWPSDIGRTCFGIIALSIAKDLGHSVGNSVDDALAWIENHYSNGSLSGEYERVFSSALTLEAVSLLDNPPEDVIENIVSLYKSIGTGWAWSFFHRPPHEYQTDTSSVTVNALVATGREDVEGIIGDTLSKIKGAQNADGGWGVLEVNTGSTLHHTLLALSVLVSAGYSQEAQSVNDGLQYIESSIGDTYLDVPIYNSRYAIVLSDLDYSTDTLYGIYNYLYLTQNPDGGWGKSPGDPVSSVSSTALALEALNDCETMYEHSIIRGHRWLNSHQNSNGSWSEIPAGNGLVENTNSTAKALKALVVTQDIVSTPCINIIPNKKKYFPGETATISMETDFALDSLFGGVILPGGDLELLDFKLSRSNNEYTTSYSLDSTTTPGSLSIAVVADFIDGTFDADVKTVAVDSPYQTDYIKDGFDANERWVQTAAPAFYNVPEYLEEAGRLGLRAGHIDTFGSWTTFDSILSTLPESLFRARYTLHSSSTDASVVPSFRLRLNREDYKMASTYVVHSTGDGSFSPTTDNKSYDVYFNPFQGPGVQESAVGGLIASFDITHFEWSDDAQVDVYMDEIEIDRLPLSFLDGEFDNPVEYTFESDEEGWVTETSPQYDAPLFSYFNGSLTMQAQNNTNTFGYWCSPTLAVVDDRVYRMRCLVGSNAAQPTESPDFRIRLTALDYQSAAGIGVYSSGDGECAPSSGVEAVYTLYYKPAPGTSSSGMVATFDMLNFSYENNPTGLLYLDNVIVDSAQEPLF